MSAHLLAVLAVHRLPGMQHHVVGMLHSAASCLQCSPVFLMNAAAALTAVSFGTEATSLHCKAPSPCIAILWCFGSLLLLRI